MLFAIPFERDYTLLGTTDQEVREIPEQARITEDEIVYICRAVNEYLEQPVRPADVVWSYSGVRPLYDDAAISASKVTRDYKLELDTEGAPILSVFGGKITTYRELAQQVIHLLEKPLDIRYPGWTAASPLPGGDIENTDFSAFLDGCRKIYPWLPDDLLYDYARNYGTRISMLLNGCREMQAMGKHFDGPLYEREVAYLMEHEFARTAEDVLWRRSKKGLFVSEQAEGDLDEWMAARYTDSPMPRFDSTPSSEGRG